MPPPSLGLVPSEDIAPPALEDIAPPALEDIAPPAPEQPPVLDQFAAPIAPHQQAPVEQPPAPPAQAQAPSLDVASLHDTFVPAAPVEPVVADVDPGPVAVERYDLDVTPASVEPLPQVANVESLEGAAVFELDAATLEAEAAINPPEAPPISIFSLGSSDPEPVVDAAESDGWISFHPDEPVAESATSPDAVEDVAQDVDPMWAIEPMEETVVAEVPSTHIESDLNTTFFEHRNSDVAEPVAEPAEGSLTAFESSGEPFQSTGTEARAAVDEFCSDSMANELFTSDDDLPIPDFTGVYDESMIETGLETASDAFVPQSVEVSKGQVASRCDELDKLRPVEDEEPVALEKEATDRSVMLQIVGVIFVGILAVLAVLLLDPAAIADMRESLEGLLP